MKCEMCHVEMIDKIKIVDTDINGKEEEIYLCSWDCIFQLADKKLGG